MESPRLHKLHASLLGSASLSGTGSSGLPRMGRYLAGHRRCQSTQPPGRWTWPPRRFCWRDGQSDDRFTASCVAPWPQNFHRSAWYSSPLELPAALAGSLLKCGEQWGEQIEAGAAKTLHSCGFPDIFRLTPAHHLIRISHLALRPGGFFFFRRYGSSVPNEPP